MRIRHSIAPSRVALLVLTLLIPGTIAIAAPSPAPRALDLHLPLLRSVGLVAGAPVRVAEATAPTAESTAPARVDAIVDAIQRTYESVEDFQASFTQEFHHASLGETRVSEGRVFFRKPGMMRWDYRTPTERFLISDGASLWVYEPEFAQYYTQSLAESQLPTALRFLMGEGDLRRDFEISLREERDGQAVLDLVPRRSEGQVRRLRFTVDLETSTVIESVIVDPLGNTNRLRLRNVRQNAGLPASGFTFTPPAGTSRITAPQ